jgi:hypothetical protein
MDKELASKVIIVLASFNGADYLRDQLDSLLAQTESRWTLLVRDDGSTDNSRKIIQHYSRKDERIHLLIDDRGTTDSALGNFSILLEAALENGAAYIFCCDQDDVWEPNKLELVLARLKQLAGGGGSPCLIHHDLVVVNKSLEPIAASFAELMRLKPGNSSNPQRLISRNEITGCALACNRALLEIALPISDQAVMHDWWLGLFAAFFGRLEFLPQCLVKYRQHSKNVIGAKSLWHGLNPMTNWIDGWQRGNDEFFDTVKQAIAFQDVLANWAGEHSEEYHRLKLYIALPAASRLRRLQSLRRSGLWRSHWVLNVILVMRMLLLPRVTEQ